VFPEKRWTFGLFCRITKIPITYYVRNRNHKLLSEIIKKHTYPGAILFSDQYSSYVNQQYSQSKLTQYGYYHFWVNHTHRFIHERFPFVGTSMIDSSWRQLKKSFSMCLKRASRPENIVEYT
jgi:hypothetical protein